MTREEEIKKIACAFAIDEVKDTCNPASKRGLLYAGLVSGAEWADAHPHWISVEDDGNPIDTGWYIFTAGKIVDVGYYLGGNEWRDVHPTHWMPLPEAPTVAKNATVKEKRTEEQKEKLRKILYQLKYITNSEEEDPFVGIYFSDLIDLLEDYKLNRLL